MNKDPIVFLKHMRDAMDDLEEYTQSLSQKKFSDSKMVQDAVIRKIEIIGEAVKNINVKFQNQYQEIPWKDIAGMRDKLIHHYFGIRLERVWNVVKEDVPSLKKQIQKILENEGAG